MAASRIQTPNERRAKEIHAGLTGPNDRAILEELRHQPINATHFAEPVVLGRLHDMFVPGRTANLHSPVVRSAAGNALWGAVRTARLSSRPGLDLEQLQKIHEMTSSLEHGPTALRVLGEHGHKTVQGHVQAFVGQLSTEPRVKPSKGEMGREDTGREYLGKMLGHQLTPEQKNEFDKHLKIKGVVGKEENPDTTIYSTELNDWSESAVNPKLADWVHHVRTLQNAVAIAGFEHAANPKLTPAELAQKVHEVYKLGSRQADETHLAALARHNQLVRNAAEKFKSRKK